MNISIAVTANLDSGNSIHSTTFKRAVSMAVQFLSSQKLNIKLIWVNDKATEAGGLEAASYIVNTSAQAVVGHFASSSALAASPIYLSANLPLFLPAATASDLTKYKNVFRICDNDSDYLRWICKWFKNTHYRHIYVETDGSVHGRSVLEKFKKIAPGDFLENSIKEADAIFYCGLFKNGLSFLKKPELKNIKIPIFLTDDMQSQLLAEHTSDIGNKIYIFGFNTEPDTSLARQIYNKYNALWGDYPGIYFYETFASMQVAANFFKTKSFETILGKIIFDKQGENRAERFCLYNLTKKKLIAVGKF